MADIYFDVKEFTHEFGILVMGSQVYLKQNDIAFAEYLFPIKV